MTNSNKKYYWIKLKEDFFRQKEIKKLRKVAGGDTYTVIYLKMLLLALKNDNKLYFEGVEDDFADELALELDEDTDNIKMTLAFLQKQKLIEMVNEDEYLLHQCKSMTGVESSSAERVRKHRLKQKEDQKVLHCNTHVTECNKNVTTEKEKEKEKEKEIDIEQQHREKEKQDVVDEIKKAFNSFDDKTIKLVADSFKRKGKDIDYLLEKIDITKKANTNNTAGYLISAITNDYKPSINNAKCFIPRQNRFNAGTNNNFMNYDPLELERMLQENQKDKFR